MTQQNAAQNRVETEVVQADDGPVLRIKPAAQVRNMTHEFRCECCGVTMKGRLNARGEVVASNAAPSGQTRTCVCAACQEATT